MNPEAERFYEGIKGKSVFFLGAGVSHRALIRKFAEKGARVTLCDRMTRDKFLEYCAELEGLGVELRLGDGYLSALGEADIVFRSPGIDYTKPEIAAAVRAGVEVTSEIETFFRLCPAHTVGVTGSDGKTTTTTLISELLREAGKRVFLGGNIGVPLLPLVDDMSADDFAVAELSSFQLISMRQSPEIAVVTNLAPNHLDHHASMDEYVGAKRNILASQSEDGIAVLNAENDITRGFERAAKGQIRWFSSRKPVENGAYIDEAHNLVLAQNGTETAIMNLDGIKLPGAHNRENAAAAAAAVMSLVPDNAIRRVVSEFPGVEHRIELVAEKNGARWYNDSIGTSPTRTIAGLRSFDRKLILLAGGYDKKISYAPLAPEIIKHVKYLLLCGDTARVIREEIEKRGDFNPSELAIEFTGGLEESVARAYNIAGEGDIVMMSPASASFDAYPNFEARGRHFKELVGALG
jgi:UDP-N-acetylmuramoylalanine--D-glutamate ligase